MRSTFISIITALLLLSPQISQSQHLVSATETGISPAVLITFIGLTDAEYNVRYYKVLYNTTDLAGAPTVASGMIAVPMDPDCDSLPIALYAHGTVMLKTDVPSYDNTEANLGRAIASRGYVVAMPDYLGLGDSPGFHTYQHWETAATASIDLLRATKEFVQDSMLFDYSNEMFITGYSQGGHAAMATAKYIQDNQLETEFNIAGLAPMSGPYHISKRQTDELLVNTPFNYPQIIVYMIMSYENIYGGIYNTNSDFLKAPYDTLIPPFYDGLHTMTEVQALMPTQVNDYLNPNFVSDLIADSSAKSSPMWQALLDNDNFNWTPNFPVNLLYCNGDDLVNPANTLDAFNAMTANGVTSIKKEDLGNLGHVDCAIPATRSTIDYFQDLRTDCKAPEPSNINDIEISYNLNAFPNPVQDQLFIELDNNDPARIEIYTVNGSLMYSNSINRVHSVSTINWSNGVYFVLVNTETKILMKKITVTH